MHHDRLVVIDKDASWPRLEGADTELGFFRGEWQPVASRTSDIGRESTDLEEVAAIRAVAALQVTDDSWLQPGVGAADYPVEFARPPRWAPGGPSRFCASADTDHVGI